MWNDRYNTMGRKIGKNWLKGRYNTRKSNPIQIIATSSSTATTGNTTKSDAKVDWTLIHNFKNAIQIIPAIKFSSIFIILNKLTLPNICLDFELYFKLWEIWQLLKRNISANFMSQCNENEIGFVVYLWVLTQKSFDLF